LNRDFRENGQGTLNFFIKKLSNKIRCKIEGITKKIDSCKMELKHVNLNGEIVVAGNLHPPNHFFEKL